MLDRSWKSERSVLEQSKHDLNWCLNSWHLTCFVSANETRYSDWSVKWNRWISDRWDTPVHRSILGRTLFIRPAQQGEGWLFVGSIPLAALNAIQHKLKMKSDRTMTMTRIMWQPAEVIQIGQQKDESEMELIGCDETQHRVRSGCWRRLLGISNSSFWDTTLLLAGDNII